MERKQVLGSLVLILLFTVGCMGSRSHEGELVPVQFGGARDSLIVLRTRAPEDSVVMRRGEFSIVLSMRDIETLSSRARPSSDRARLRDVLRRATRESGWANLGEGETEDFLAADLITSGQATVRNERGEQFLPWVRRSLERQSIGNGSTVVEYEVFTGPDDEVVLRVMSSVVVS